MRSEDKALPRKVHMIDPEIFKQIQAYMGTCLLGFPEIKNIDELKDFQCGTNKLKDFAHVLIKKQESPVVAGHYFGEIAFPIDDDIYLVCSFVT